MGQAWDNELARQHGLALAAIYKLEDVQRLRIVYLETVIEAVGDVLADVALGRIAPTSSPVGKALKAVRGVLTYKSTDIVTLPPADAPPTAAA